METTLTDVLDKFRKELTKDDLEEVVRYKWDQAKYDPTLETFSDFLKRQKVIRKQTFLDNAVKFIQAFLFGKLLINIQQDLKNNLKEDASPEEIKTFLHRRQQYNQFAHATTPQLFHQASMNQPDAPKQAQHQQPDVKWQTRQFDDKCFFCD